MFTIVQEETNKIQIFEDVNFTHLLIVFTYQNLEVVGLFANQSVNCPYYLIDIVEVGENGTVDNVNGEIKLSPQTTWKGTVYGQDSDSNLFPVNATLIDTYNFQVKGDSENNYPVISPQIDCADATAVVKDQDGNILATENIPSGESRDIPVNVGGGILYTYNYPALNTGQDVSYATGDDKWVRDNVLNPEVATWDNSLKWVFPVLDPNDPTKLQFGSDPDGSGNNIFGNKERFTDDLGGQDYTNDLVIDHYSGEMWDKRLTVTGTYFPALNYCNDLVFSGYNDFHLPNVYELVLLQNLGLDLAYNYHPFNYSESDGNFSGRSVLSSSTTSKRNSSNNYVCANAFTQIGGNESAGGFVSREKRKTKESFQYEKHLPTTQQHNKWNYHDYR